MNTFTPTRPVSLAPPGCEDPKDPEQARAENLESLPARLEPYALAKVMELHEKGKALSTIAGRLSLDPLVVCIEVRRELERRAEQERAAAAEGDEARETDEQELPALLTRLEMNRLAKGSYIPNKQLRVIVDRAVARRPGMKVSAVLREFGIKDTTHAKRLLGYSPYSGADRPGATISVEQATRLLDSLGRDPVDVVGL
jgi:hypothetical protein